MFQSNHSHCDNDIEIKIKICNVMINAYRKQQHNGVSPFTDEELKIQLEKEEKVLAELKENNPEYFI